MSTKYFDYRPIVGCTTVRLQTICIRNIRVFYSVQSLMVDALPCPGSNGSWLHQQLNSRWSHWRAGPYYGCVHESPKLTSTTNHLLLIPTAPIIVPRNPITLTRNPLSESLRPQNRKSSSNLLVLSTAVKLFLEPLLFWSPLLRSPF